MLRLLFFQQAAVISLALGAEFHVSPDGTATGDGSTTSPWDLTTVLSHPEPVQPGDTIWLHGGEYRGSFESHLTGAAEQPIILRQAPGERATICLEKREGAPINLTIRGEHARYQGFEVVCKNPKRETKLKGSWPTDLQRGSVTIRGNHIQAVNLIVHDLGSGFGFWREGEGGEIYGCLIYNNGWIGPDRGHGHAIYTQNERGIKKIVDCLMFRQFGSGLHLYGTGKSTLRGYRIEGVAAFETGRGGGRNLLVGGGAPLDDIVLANCFTYGSGGVQVGYSSGVKNRSVQVLDNYFAGGLRLQYPGSYTVRGNTIVAPSGLLTMQLHPKHDLSQLTIDANTYHKTEEQWNSFAIYAPEGNRSGDVTMLQKAGFDAQSTYAETPPTLTKVFVRPNRYEPGRAHVIVYNWARSPAIQADLSRVLKRGQAYRIAHARNFFGKPAVEGVFDEKPVSIQMTPRHAASPIGWETKPEQTQAEFAAFVVLPR